MENIKKKIKKEKEVLKLPSAHAEGGSASDQASKLNAENSARFVESAQAQLGRKPKKILWIKSQSSVARAGVSRMSSIKPWIADEP